MKQALDGGTMNENGIWTNATIIGETGNKRNLTNFPGRRGGERGAGGGTDEDEWEHAAAISRRRKGVRDDERGMTGLPTTNDGDAFDGPRRGLMEGKDAGRPFPACPGW